MSSRLMCQITTDRISGFAEDVYDLVAAILAAGTNVTLTPNDGTNTVTIAASGGGGGTTNASDLTSGTLADARLSANVPLLDAANAFGRNTTIRGSSGNTNGTPVLTILSRLGADWPCVVLTDNGPSYFNEIRLGSATGTGYATDGFLVAPGSIQGTSAFAVQWTGSGTYSVSPDVALGRAAAGVLALGDAGAGNDPGLRLVRKSSTTDGRTLGALKGAWSDSTDASRKADMILLTDGYNGPHEALRCHDTGSSAQVILPVASVPDAADDSIASGLSPAVPVGGLYRTGNALKIRLA